DAVSEFESALRIRPGDLGATLALGEARLAAGDDRGAFGAFRDVAAPLEAAQTHSGDYWQAWTRMLEILSRQNADGSRTPTIRPEIEPLRKLDTAPARAPCLERLRAIEASLPAGS